MPESRPFTPPTLGDRWGVKPERIIAWIRSGELKAINVAANTAGRPRWRILPESVAQFEAKRSAVAAAPTPRTRRKRQGSNVIEFF